MFQEVASPGKPSPLQCCLEGCFYFGRKSKTPVLGPSAVQNKAGAARPHPSPHHDVSTQTEPQTARKREGNEAVTGTKKDEGGREQEAEGDGERGPPRA